MMKGLFGKRSSPDLLNYASSSGHSGEDKEIGSFATSKGEYVSTNTSDFHCLKHKIDFNPARMVFAEMVGTFILMFCVCGIIASTQLTKGQVGLMEYAATAGLTIAVIVFSIGPISCAHVNPAVTVAFAFSGHFSWRKVPIYILAQIVGSVLATCIGSSVYGIKPDDMITQPLQGLESAFWVELLATFIIMFLAAALTWEAQSVGHLSGFVVGIAIGLAVLITGPVSGGSLNPARSIGPAILSWKFKDTWIYITAPTIGAIAGALMFRLLRLQQHPPCNTSPAGTKIRRSMSY